MRFILCLISALFFLSFCAALPQFGGVSHRQFRGALNRRYFHTNAAPSPHDAPPQYMDQLIDHFSLSDRRTFKQKFYVNDTFYTPSGPVFFMLGGEGPCGASTVGGHFIMNNYAQKYGAMIVAAEHRFYGESIPLNNSDTATLRYLSSQQALADYAAFHDYFNQLYNIPSSAKWIAFGGSYSGNLAAWLRAKYPHLFAGAIAASAPVLAQLDFPEYFEVVANSLGDQCTKSLQVANDHVLSLLDSANGRSQLAQTFNTCTPIVTDLDVAQFLSSLSDPFASVVQYSNDNTKYEPYNVTVLCNYFSDAQPGEEYDAMIKIVQSYRSFSEPGACMDISYQNYIKEMQQTGASRSWTWQTCTEFGYYQTGESKQQPFSPKLSLNFFVKQCEDIFGIKGLTPNIDETNRYYGAKNIVVDNVLFTNGDVDPWHILGLTDSSSPLPGQNTGVVFIHGTAHCADLYPPRDADVIGLVKAREMHVQMLDTWLAN